MVVSGKVVVAWVVVIDVDVVCTEIININTNIYDYQKKSAKSKSVKPGSWVQVWCGCKYSHPHPHLPDLYPQTHQVSHTRAHHYPSLVRLLVVNILFYVILLID